MEYFKREEFYKEGTIVSDEIMLKIYEHIRILNRVRNDLGSELIVSQKSGYRPREYELTKGRSGNSEQCFVSKGAVDLTCDLNRIIILLDLLLKSEYTRVCYYPDDGFIHCDSKSTDKRSYVKRKTDSDWVRYDFTADLGIGIG